MVTTINDIKSVNWQMGLTGPGDVVESFNDIKQCVGLILTTSRGSDPLRPEFGTDIFKLVDRPVNFAAPAIISEVLKGIQLWEPRIRVERVIHSITGQERNILSIDMQVQVIASGQSDAIKMELQRADGMYKPKDTRAFGHGFSIDFS